MPRTRATRARQTGPKRLRGGLFAGLAAAAVLAAAGLAWGEVDESAGLRVGTSGDYPPFGRARDGRAADYEGFDIALARAYAADRGLALEFVRFRWPRLMDDLQAGRFDVAMSGITVRPERSALGRFTLPVVESGAVVLVGDADRFDDLDRLNLPRVRLGVNAGGHLERAARERFSHATLLAIPDNASVLRALREAHVDAVVTDSLEADVWQRSEPDLARLGPFTRDRKAFLVRPDAADLAGDLDDWLLLKERDGTLARLRSEHLGAGAGPATAMPLPALVAALDERLSLMPVIGVVKRRSGVPLEVPERESAVLDAAAAAALEAAHTRNVAPPSFLDLRKFFGAVLDAAKEVQWKASRDPSFAPEEPLPELDGALRPALERIDARIARLLVELPDDLDAAASRAAVADGLRTRRLSDASKRAIADALAALGRRAAPSNQ
jgi:cyclohexadienyl dehydratase